MANQNADGPQQPSIGKSSVADAQRVQERRERDRAYRSAHAEEIAAKARIWREANKDHIREEQRRWKEENRERSRELNRESMRRTAARRRRLADLRRKARERSAEWKRQHPERVREYKKQWATDNHDKMREYYRRYHAKHRDEVNARATARRDADPEKVTKARKEWANRNKDRLAEIQRNYRSDPEKYRAVLDSNSAAKRLGRRLERAGLPSKKVHRSSAAERRANEHAADEYFGNPDLPQRLRQFTAFTEALTAHLLANGARMREFAEAYVATRERMGLPNVDVEKVVYARAVEIVTNQMRRVDQLTGRDVAAGVRSAKAAVAERERGEQYAALLKAVDAHIRRHSVRLSTGASAVNRARMEAGQPKIPMGPLIVRIALSEAMRVLRTDKLRVGDLRLIRDVALRRLERQNLDQHLLVARGPSPSQPSVRLM